MGLNNTPMSERVHIGFFGRRNAGKSSVMNAVTGQDLAVVSDVKGTTTDPVYKSMELLPIGPVVMIDTPGIDDEGELGKLRVKKSYQTLNKTDAAVLVIDAAAGVSGEDKKLLEKIKAKKIPYVVALNKKELAEEEDMERIKKELDSDGGWIIEVSAAAGDGICELKEKIAAAVHQEETENVLVRDLLHPSDIVVLVVPVDSAAHRLFSVRPEHGNFSVYLESAPDIPFPAYFLTCGSDFWLPPSVPVLAYMRYRSEVRITLPICHSHRPDTIFFFLNLINS